MHKSYQKFAKFYDAMHARRDYSKETNFTLDVVNKLNKKVTSMLDVGCGTGTHLEILSQHFPTQYGIDLNSEILEIAKEKCPAVKFNNASMTDFKLNQKVDVITSYYSVFNYNLTLEDAEKTLVNFHNHLNSSGVIVLALYKAKNLERKVSIHVGNFNNTESAKINDYVYDPSSKIETSSFVLFWKDNGKVDFETENNHQFRIYDYSELDELLEKTGFKNAKYFDGFNDRPATEDSFYPILVAQKK